MSERPFTGFLVSVTCLVCGSGDVEISADGYDSELYGSSWHLHIECGQCKQAANIYESIKSGARATGL